jgi:hypothetical protein
MERAGERRYTYDDIFRSDDPDSEDQVFQIKLLHEKNLLKPSPEILKQGWGKYTKCRFSSYSKVFLSLSPTSLEIYSSEEKTEKLATLNFELFSLEMTQISKTELKISAYSCKSSLKLKFPQSEVKQWSFAITSTLSQHHPNTKISRLSPSDKFWKNSLISEPSFLKSAQSGDLLLFRGKNLGSKLQRCLTRSKYDHVGLVMKFSNEEVGFLEASRAFGVVLTYWDKLFRKDWRKIYAEVWYRKLELVRTEEIIENLEKFVNETKGKSYSLGIGKGKKNVRPGNEETFFCSELIASAYKVMGVIDEEVPSFKYFPSHFVGDEKLQMIRGRLDEEKLIDMDFVVIPYQDCK